LNGTSNAAGSGGTGLSSTITGARVFYAGGGAGGVNDYTGQALGGGGGGADAPTTADTNGNNGTANTGGGGSGGRAVTVNVSGGAGGSGIVIIRYPANCAPPASTTGLQQVLYNNSYQIYVFTSSGTITF
jgi:hypothetical protein